MKIKRLVYGKFRKLDDEVEKIDIEIHNLNDKKLSNISQLETIRKSKDQSEASVTNANNNNIYSSYLPSETADSSVENKPIYQANLSKEEQELV